MRWGLPKQVMTVVAGSFLLAAYPLGAYADREVIASVIAGAFLGTLNTFIGYVTIEYAFPKSMTTFMKVVIGGMGIRLALMLGLMIFFIVLVKLNTVALIMSLFFFYAVYLVLEIIYIQKKVHSKTR